ncbi:zf-HC2 domain-containing protein [Lysinibacillus sp. NPDC093688]|uniref:zf-HC2 domain-containing protein n=1 Tax=Lysinibacillus sp. NPDC093688 TaxID=3390577 RepID=UPI003D030FD2
MEDSQKIHILSRELISVFDELEQETQEVVLEHIQDCSECRQLFNELAEGNYPMLERHEEVKIKPLKKLVQFNHGLKWLFISIRALILFYILYSSFHFYNWELSADAALEYIKSVTFIFYFPVAIFLSVFTIVFFSKRWIIPSILFDLGIIFFLDTLISIFYEYMG